MKPSTVLIFGSLALAVMANFVAGESQPPTVGSIGALVFGAAGMVLAVLALASRVKGD